jgi:hypothetical protein
VGARRGVVPARRERKEEREPSHAERAGPCVIETRTLEPKWVANLANRASCAPVARAAAHIGDV